jgi:hypothetical protein
MGSTLFQREPGGALVKHTIFIVAAAIITMMSLAGICLAAETTVSLSFEEYQFLFDTLQGFNRIRLIDGAEDIRPGEPALPVQHILVAIPAGHEATGVQVRALGTRELAGRYDVFPGQPPRRLDGSPPPKFVEPLDEIYTSSAPYPGQLARLAGQTDLAGQQMAAVTVSPLQYVPAEGRLILHRTMNITVQTRPGRSSRETFATFMEKHRRHYRDMITSMVINPENIILDPPMTSPSKSLPAGDFDHVNITSSSFAPAFDDLVEWHNKRGLRDTVVTTTYIYANYSGADNPEKIRNFIIDARGTWGTMYFLIGGESGTVPFKYRTYYDENTPSDHYYSDYDDDWTCEVFVGRLSASTITQFGNAIDKILHYEKTPPTSGYPQDALLIGMDLDPSTQGQDLKETIDGYIPSGWNVTKVYDSHGGNHKTNAINALNAGQNLVNHADHCNSTVIGTGSVNHGWGIYNSDVDALTNNGQPSNVVSLGCWPNDMTYNDGISEHFVVYNANQAGVSFTGNTRSGWGYVGYPESLSGQLDRDWWRGLFNSGQYLLGHALAWSQHQFSTGGGDASLKQHCEWTFSLLGDPAMPLWTANPAALTATHPATLPVGSSSFQVHVESGGSPVSTALVCLWKQGEVYLTNTTNSSGDVTFTPDPSSAGTLLVTVTKRNYLPHESDAEVIPGGPPPAVTDLGIALSRDDVVLTWSPPGSKAVVRYVVYRNTDPDFIPAPGDSIGGTTGTAYTDPGAAGNAGAQYFYCVQSANESGQESDPSGIVGEYDISLINMPPE